MIFQIPTPVQSDSANSLPKVVEANAKASPKPDSATPRTRKTVTRPDGIAPSHWDEWVTGSGISPEITALNLHSAKAPELKRMLGWKGCSSDGWYARTCSGQATSESPSEAPRFFTAKLDYPLTGNDGKIRKYSSPRKDLLPMNVIRLAHPDLDYWAKIESNKTPVVITEGVKKAAALMTAGIPAIALAGVQCFGFKRTSANTKSKQAQPRNLYPGLATLTETGRDFIILFDADLKTNPCVRLALRDLGASLEECGCDCKVAAIPAEWQTKGIDDVLVMQGLPAVTNIVNSAVEFGEWLDSYFDKKPAPMPAESEAAEQLAEALEGRVVYLSTSADFARYVPELGYWERLDSDQTIRTIEEAINVYVSPEGMKLNYVKAVIGFLKGRLRVESWEESKGLKNFLNGTLDIDSGELLPHSPHLHVLDIPTIRYDRDAKCEAFQKILADALPGDPDSINMIIAFMRATLTGASDLHAFLEVDGEGGAGKSILLSVFSMLAGKRNTGESSLAAMEGDKYQMYNLIDKSLILVRDSDKFQGDTPMLKSLTGGDAIRLEAKYKQPEGVGRVYRGMVVIASNYPIKFAADSNSIFRRRRVVKFDRIIAESDKILPEVLLSRLEKELPGIINYVLSMSKTEMENIISNPKTYALGVYQNSRNQIVETNPLAEWADNFLVLDPEARIQIGKATQTGPGEWAHMSSQAYPSYRLYCSENNYTKPLTPNTFTNALKSQLCAMLKLPVEFVKPSNKSIIKGVRLRNEHDRCPKIISGEPWDDGSDDQTGSPVEAYTPAFAQMQAQMQEQASPPAQSHAQAQVLTQASPPAQAQSGTHAAAKEPSGANWLASPAVGQLIVRLKEANKSNDLSETKAVVTEVWRFCGGDQAKLDKFSALLLPEDKPLLRQATLALKIQISW